jgi:general secretion pathway protein G
MNQIEIKTMSTREAAATDLETLATLLNEFRADCGRYPTTREGLRALVMCPDGLEDSWKGPYVSKHLPRDPWGASYRYLAPGISRRSSFDLYTLGADGKPGGEGEDADLWLGQHI